MPAPQLSEFPPLLAEHGPFIHLYSPETVIAEKFNAIVLLGMANSRMKDYFDFWMFSRNFTIEGAVLQEAIRQNFARRQTLLPESEPIGLSEEFSSNESKRSQWQGFVSRQRRREYAPDLSEIVTTIRDFLMPIVSGIAATLPPATTWTPDKGWQN